MTVRTMAILFCDWASCPCNQKASFTRVNVTSDNELRMLARREDWTFEVIEETTPELDGTIIDMCPEANRAWQAIETQLRARGDIADD